MSKKVLIADADFAFSTQLSEELQRAGFEVVTTDSGFKANALIDAEAFVGVIAAVKLAGMSGVQVVANTKASELNAKAAILVLVDAPDEEVTRRLGQIGIAQLVAKPVAAADVVAKLQTSIPAKPKAPEGYDVRIINAFVEAMSDVMEFYFSTRPRLGKPAIKTDHAAIGELSALIGFNGENIKGSMAMSFQSAFVKRLSEKVFDGQTVEMTNDMIADMAGEMCNQVCGAVKLKLAKLGLKVMIGLPKVVTGKAHGIIHIVKNPVIWLPVEHEGGKCSIEFCMTKCDEPLPEGDQAEDDAQAGDVLLF